MWEVPICFFIVLEVFFSLQLASDTSCIVISHLNELTKEDIFHYYGFFFNLTNKKSEKASISVDTEL